MEDYEIIDLYWKRDEEAIVETDRKYGALCRRIAGNILPLREDAEECVNDSYYRAWKAIPPQRPLRLRAWLARIVRNTALNLLEHARAQKRYAPGEQLLSELEDCIPSAESVEQALDAGELTDFLNHWLDSLPTEDRKLFLRRYWNGDAVKSLAKELGISSGKVSQDLFRLRKKLKAALEKGGFTL